MQTDPMVFLANGLVQGTYRGLFSAPAKKNIYNLKAIFFYRIGDLVGSISTINSIHYFALLEMNLLPFTAETLEEIGSYSIMECLTSLTQHEEIH